MCKQAIISSISLEPISQNRTQIEELLRELNYNFKNFKCINYVSPKPIKPEC